MALHSHGRRVAGILEFGGQKGGNVRVVANSKLAEPPEAHGGSTAVDTECGI